MALRLGKVFGISVEIDTIFLLLLLFVLFLGLTGPSPNIGLFLIIFLLYLCVFMHELSHAITAMNNNLRVRKITLNLWGGFTSIDDLRIDPRVELNVALSGPVTSLLLGGLFGILVVFTPPGAITLLVQDLFFLNVLLGLLNLLPAFPMDGGRVMRSFMQRSMDQFKATLATARVSRVMIVVIGLGSLAYVLYESGGVLLKGFLLIFIMLFLVMFWQATRAEVDLARMRKALGATTIRGVASRRFAVIDPKSGVGRLYRLVKPGREHFLVARHGDAYGIVDIFDKARMERASRVADLVVTVPNIGMGTKVIDAMMSMEADNSSMAVVVRSGRPVGVVDAKHLQAFISLRMMSRRKGKVLNS